MSFLLTVNFLFSAALMAQNSTRLVPTEIFNFGTDVPEVGYFAWNSADFVIEANPAGDFPSADVRKWQKLGNWTGVGATLTEPASIQEAEKLSIWIYNDAVDITMAVVELRKGDTPDGDPNVIYNETLNLSIPAQSWGQLVLDLNTVRSQTDSTHFDGLLIMADGNIVENINSNYYFAGVSLEFPVVAADDLMMKYHHSIVVDGEFGDWSKISSQAISMPMSEDDVIDDDADFKTDLQAVWDDERLYLNIKVVDQELVNADSLKAWNKDGLEIAFNMIDLESYNFWDMSDAGKLLINVGDTRDSILNAPDRRMGNFVSYLSGDVAAKFDMACDTMDNGVQWEIAIPYAAITPDFVPGNDVEFQMAIVAIDNDGGEVEARNTWGGQIKINKDNSDFPTVTMAGKADGFDVMYHNSIVVDGDLGDWSKVKTKNVSIHDENQVVDDANDFEVKYGALWSADKLYLQIQVKDQEIVNADSLAAWNRDAFEIAFNMVDLSTFNFWDMSDAGKLLLVAGDNRDSVLTASDRRMGNVVSYLSGDVAENFEYTEVATDNGYIIEMGLPFAALVADYTPANDMEFQMAIKTIDNDGGNVEARMCYGGFIHINKNNGDFPVLKMVGKTNDLTIKKHPWVSVDGDLKDWADVDVVDVNIPAGTAAIDDNADFGATYSAVWDETRLYMNINVTDQEIVNADSIATWNRDAIELAFNMVDFTTYNFWDMSDAGKFLIVAGDDKDSILNASDRRMGNVVSYLSGEVADAFEFQMDMTATGYSIEMAIPYDALVEGYTPAKDVQFKMGIKVIDNDGGEVQARLSYGGAIHINKNSGDFPVITLSDEEIAFGTSVEENMSAKLDVYPNPVTANEIYLKLAGNDAISKGNILLFNEMGQRVISRTIESHYGSTIRVQLPEDLEAGFYVLQVQTGKKLLTKKLLIK